jgi:hypothetical protein
MKIPIPLNDLDKAILAFKCSQAAVPDLLRLLCEGNLYLLAPFHPEVANQNMSYLEGQPFPFLRLKTAKGDVKVAVFSSEARALESLKKAKVRPRTYMPCVMSAKDVLGMLGKLNLAMSVNIGCSTGDISLPPESLLKLASGAAFKPAMDEKGSERLRLDKIDPADYPTALVQAVFEFCRLHGEFRAVWIFTRVIAGQPAPALKPYYLLVLMEPRDTMLFHDFLLVAKSVSREYEVNLSLTESNTPGCVADLFRQAQPFYVAAGYQPPAAPAPAGP